MNQITKYILLLRAVNVGGKNVIKMQHLKEVFTAAGFFEVRTYIQSGNVVFESKMFDEKVVKQDVLRLLKENYNYELSFVLMKFSRFVGILQLLPSSFTSLKKYEKVYVSFLTETPNKPNCDRLKKLSNENEYYHIHDDIVFSRCMKDGRKLKFSNNYIEKLLKVAATTRNLNTVTKLTTY